MTRPVAVIDVGTNSTRLLIVDGSGTALVRDTRVTRLGAGVDASRHIANDAVERVAACMRDYRSECDRVGVEPDRIRAVATSAVRDAVNRDAVLGSFTAALGGVAPIVLSGTDEGRFCYDGATSELRPKSDDGYDLVLDIGGGSTEFAVGRPGEEPVGVWSADMGCVRVTEQFLHGDPPNAEELSQAMSVVHVHLDDVEREVPEVRHATRLIGVAGSITTVAAVEIGLQVYDRDRIHRFVLTKAAAEDVFRTLATEARADRAFNPGLARERVDTIVGGALILVTVMRQFGFEQCVVSETDILDGVARSMLRPQQ